MSSIVECFRPHRPSYPKRDRLCDRAPRPLSLVFIIVLLPPAFHLQLGKFFFSTELFAHDPLTELFAHDSPWSFSPSSAEHATQSVCHMSFQFAERPKDSEVFVQHGFLTAIFLLRSTALRRSQEQAPDGKQINPIYPTNHKILLPYSGEHNHPFGSVEGQDSKFYPMGSISDIAVVSGATCSIWRPVD